MRLLLIIRIAVIVVTAIGCISIYSKAAAVAVLATPTIDSFTQEDIDGDSNPDLAIFMVDYFGARYRVLVYDQGGDMPWSEDWNTGTDFANDIWIFQTEAGDQTKLIIRFSQDSANYTAELFDDVNGDGKVDFEVTGAAGIRITESSFPTVKLESDQAWISPEGEVNHAVRVSIFRPMSVALGGPAEWQVWLPGDGRISQEQEAVDTDADGIPDYELMRAFYDKPYPEWGLFRTSVNVNVDGRPLPAFTDYLLWPYLGQSGQATSEGLQNASPPIKMDWPNAKIRSVSPILPYHGLGNQWWAQSWIPLEKDRVNELDWERYAYYSFSGNANPDMVVKLRQGYPTQKVVVGSKELQVENVSYSWKHQNLGTLTWDYKLDLAGLHELPDTEVPFGDFALREVPYEQYPAYYAEQEWAYATFVAAEGRLVANNEGMQEWFTLHGVQVDQSLPLDLNLIPGSQEAQFNYLIGDADVSPAEYYRAIKTGWRGEYGELDEEQARLYLSPIDHKLHLEHASFGVWNLDETKEIRYRNLGGDYLNEWVLLENGRALKSLRYIAGHLIYEDGDSVKITEVDINQAPLKMPPPRNQEEWESLGAALNEHKPDFHPDDIETMGEQFEGRSVRILGASLRDFRSTPSGFHFILELQPGFRVSQNDGTLISLPDSPGNFAVDFDGQTWSIQPTTPAALEVSDIQVSTDGGVVQAVRWATVDILLRNSGQEDVHDLPVCITLDNKIDRRIVMTDTVALLPGEGQQRIAWQWAPPAAGSWQVRVAAYCDGPEPMAVGGELLAEAIMEVSETGKPSLPWLLSLGERVPETIALFLFATMTMVGAVAAVWVKRSGL